MKTQDSPGLRTFPSPVRALPGLGPVPPLPSLDLQRAGYTISLARNIDALQACLALESASQGEGIAAPSAVPYCEFLMLHDAERALAGVCRLLPLDPDAPFDNPLASGRYQLSPFLTALRYARRGVLEAGSITVAPGFSPDRAAELLWHGIIAHLENLRMEFVLGRERVSAGAQALGVVAELVENHGLHPDLQVEAREAFRAEGWTAAGEVLPRKAFALPAWLPPGLKEVLRRGGRLAGEPIMHHALGYLEFVWVASRDMLEP